MALSDADRVYDALLVTLVRAGDARAAERLAARWQPRLLRAARRMLGDGEEAREAVQEAWGGIAVWAGIQMYNASEPRLMVFWLGVFLFAMIALGLLKIWFWMRMNHLALLLELKRIELRLVRAS